MERPATGGMLSGPSYAQILRAIGQDLEAASMRYFELKAEGEDYLVRSETSAEHLEVRCTPEDIGHLERQGRARRSDPFRTPDFSTLSQVLRAIGHYVDRKDGYLLAVTKRFPSLCGRVLSVQYKTARGGPTKEEFSASDVQALFVRMYKRRLP